MTKFTYFFTGSDGGSYQAETFDNNMPSVKSGLEHQLEITLKHYLTFTEETK